jgi:hypothetical protein
MVKKTFTLHTANLILEHQNTVSNTSSVCITHVANKPGLVRDSAKHVCTVCMAWAVLTSLVLRKL